jgi:hypothetical protein
MTLASSATMLRVEVERTLVARRGVNAEGVEVNADADTAVKARMAALKSFILIWLEVCVLF